MAETRRFLRFTGRLFENGEFEPETGWETEKVFARPEAGREVTVALCDADGQVLLRAPAGLDRSVCRRAGRGMRWDRIVAYVPMHPAGAVVELHRESQVIYRAELAPRRPEVAITRLDVRDDAVTIAWRATHDRPLTFLVVFVDGRGRAFQVARGLEQTEHTVDTARLPGGEGCRLAVLATDRLRSSHAVSDVFRLPEKPLRVYISQPLEGQSFGPHQPVTLSGRALDAGGATVAVGRLRWTVDGQEVGRHAPFTLCGPLAPGAHSIALAVDGGEGGAEVTISVRDANEAEKQWRREAEEMGLLTAETKGLDTLW